MHEHHLNTGKATILVVDDIPENLRLLMGILVEHGYDVRLASDGAIALQSIRVTPPDLILLDIKMPGMSGFEVCEQLKADERTRPIPVIFISALNEMTDKVKGFAAGGIDYIIKPIQVEEVLARVETHLALYRLRHYLEELVQERTSALQAEITERQRAEQALRESEEKFRKLFRLAPVPISLSSLEEGRFEDANEAFLTITGFTRDEVIGRTSIELGLWDDPTDRQAILESLQQQGFVKDVVTQIRTKSGTERTGLFSAEVVILGHRQCLVAMFVDLTERYKIEEALDQARKEWEDIFQAIGHITLILDKEHRILAANRSALEATGLNEHEIATKTCFEIFHHAHAAPDMCPLQRAQNSNLFETVTMEMEALNGVFLVSCTPIFDVHGELQKFIHIATDITTLKRTEEALQKSEQQYRLLVENVTDGIGIIQQNRLVFVNEALASLLGYSYEQLLGQSPVELLHGAYQTYFGKTVHRLEANPAASPWQVLEFVVTEQGQEIWMEGCHSAILWEGKPAILVTMRDVTERKRQEAALNEERDVLRRENLVLRSAMKERYRFGEIIGHSPAMQIVYERITQAAASDANVVIYGESGTGKDLVAQTIHQMSQRSKKPFVAVNCGSIPEHLFESEFFGYRKGAFTGALRDKPGFFDAAYQGVLFLDEVGELPLAMQVKLLRAIEGNGYTPVGDQMMKQADVRIIAATNRNLHDQVKQGRIREDFFYRITVLTITVPPLRERREDIPLLVEYFLTHYSPDSPPEMLPGNTLEVLYHHDWPGNIRQLQNVLQRYMTLKYLDFGDHGRDERYIQPENPAEQGFWQLIEEFEKRLICEALQRNHGHKTNTAKMLQIPLRTLQRKLQQHHLE
jgi:PAS domain S-box-containing protein